MKKRLLVCLIVLLQNLSFAQSFDLDIFPNPALVDHPFVPNDPLLDILIHSDITNNSSDSLSYNWEVIDLQMPAAWKTVICDVFICYTPGIYENLSGPIPILAGEEHIFDVHFYPENTPGIGIMTVQFSNNQNASEKINAVYILNYGENANLNLIEGNISWRGDGLCDFDSTNTNLSGWTVQADGDQDFYASTDSVGNFWMYAFADDYVVSAIPNNPYWEICDNDITVSIDSTQGANVNFVADRIIECPLLEVDISTPFLRRCFDNRYFVNYCNQGTTIAEDAYIEVLFDDYLTVLNSSIPITNQNGQLFTFDIGDVDINDCGSFYIDTYLDCDSTVLGQTHCVEAHIYPDSICTPNSVLWTGAEVEVSAACVGDEIAFKIKNTGTATTSPGLFYVVIEDHVILMHEPFSLNAGDSITWTEPANGSTFRLDADQEPYFPGESEPSVSIELCNGSSSTGFVNIFPQNDGDPFISIDCQENIGAYDPNDKQGFPIGFDDEHFIEKNTDIEYLIRFQNTGTDTAFNISILDTLSDFLDITQLRPGASSHSYNLEINGDNTIKFVFPNIMLADSNINEPASHGFVKFKIAQRIDNPLGSEIKNSAAIYFDFNDPVITNTTLHTIGEPFVTVHTERVYRENIKVSVSPNPFSTMATIKIEGPPSGSHYFYLHDTQGRLIRKEAFQDKQLLFYRKDLPTGLYFYRIEENGQLLATGKMMVQ